MRAAWPLSIAGPWLIAVALFAAVIITGAASASGDALVDLPTLSFLVVTGSWGLVQATVGALITARRPENRIGRLLQISGPLVVSVFLGYEVAAIRMTTFGSGDPVGGVAGWWASTTIFLAIYLAFPLVGMLYPDGRLPGPRWRLPVLCITLAEIAVATMYAVATGPVEPGLPDNPFGFVAIPAAVRDAVGLIGALALAVAMAFAVIAITVRWRRGSRLERSQLKWLFAALIIAGILFPLTFGASSSEDSPSILADLSVASALLIPIAIGIAILRYRLFEIDRLVSRTIAYVVLTAVLVAAYAGVILLLQGPLGAVTGGDTIPVAISTLVAAALFQPLRRRVQSIVDRRFDRARFDAEQTSAAFAERLREDVDIESVTRDLGTTVQGALRPIRQGLWIREASER